MRTLILLVLTQSSSLWAASARRSAITRGVVHTTDTAATNPTLPLKVPSPAKRVGRSVRTPGRGVVPTEMLIQPTFDGCAAKMDVCTRVSSMTSLAECREAVERNADCDFSIRHIRAFLPPTKEYQCHSQYMWGIDLSALSGFSLVNNVRLRSLWETECQDPLFAFSVDQLNCTLNPATLSPSSVSKSSEKGDLILEFNGLDISNTTRFLFLRPSCALKTSTVNQLVVSLSLTTTPQHEGAPYETMLMRDEIDFAQADDATVVTMDDVARTTEEAATGTLFGSLLVVLMLLSILH